MKVDVNKVKVVVSFLPENLDGIMEAICSNGAGVIGNYTCCTNYYSVTGTFLPNTQAKPYVGKANVLEKVNEYKLEVICEINKVKKVIDAIRKVHLYEEPEIDIIPLIEEEDL